MTATVTATPTAIYPSLKDRVVFVTGGGGGIGAAIVEHFYRQGAKVGFVDIDEAGSAALVEALAKEGHARPRFVKCDISDIEALRIAIGQVRSALGPITVLVNNAAKEQRQEINVVTPEYVDELIAVNMKHPLFADQ